MGVQEAKEEEGCSKACTSTRASARASRGAIDACNDATCHHFCSHPFILHGGDSSVCSSHHSLCCTSNNSLRDTNLCSSCNHGICCSRRILHRLRVSWCSGLKSSVKGSVEKTMQEQLWRFLVF